MIGFFSRWGQLSRRYLWPHLLFGIVAAGFGLPIISAAGGSSNDLPVANNLSINPDVRTSHLIRLRELVARPTFVHDYWHRHAIRVVIRHLTFSLPNHEHQFEHTYSSLTAKGVAFLHAVFALLTSDVIVRISRKKTQQSFRRSPANFSVASWFVRVGGIRAGPVTA